MGEGDARPARAPHQRDLTEGPVGRTLFAFALPSLGVNILQSANGSVNAVWIGQFLGEEAVAATSSAGMTMFLMFATLFGFSMAATIMIGQAMGRRDIDAVRRIVGSSVGLFVIAGVVTAALGWVYSPELLRLLATPEAAFPLALAYLRVIFLGMPMSFVMILLSSALRGVGDSVTPFRATILNVVLDVVLNPVLILGLGPAPAMGIAGSAVATLIAGVISTSYLLWQIYAHDLSIRLRGAELAYLRPRVETARPMIAKGFPMGLSMIIMAGSSLAMVGLVNREGVATAAAFGVMNQLWSYLQMPAVAVGSAVSAMAAQNIGAGKWDRLGKVALAGVGINTAMTIALLAAITLFIHPLLGLFLPEGSAAIPIAVHINWTIGWTFVLMGMSMVIISIIRANGAVLMPLLFLIFSAIIVRFAIGFGLHDRYGADAIWWAFIGGSIASMPLTLGYYLQGGWKKARMVAAPASV